MVQWSEVHISRNIVLPCQVTYRLPRLYHLLFAKDKHQIRDILNIMKKIIKPKLSWDHCYSDQRTLRPFNFQLKTIKALKYFIPHIWNSTLIHFQTVLSISLHEMLFKLFSAEAFADRINRKNYQYTLHEIEIISRLRYQRRSVINFVRV